MTGARSRSILHPGRLPTLALLLVAVGLMLARPGAGPMAQPVFAQAQSDGLFYDVEGEPPPSIGVDSLASRLAGIDFGQLAQVVDAPVSPRDPVTGKPAKPQTLALNLFDDVVFTGIVEHVEPTSSGDMRCGATSMAWSWGP